MSTLKPGLSPCAYWPKRPTSSRDDRGARSFEAVALERAPKLVVLTGVFQLIIGANRITEAPAARVEPKGLCCAAGDVVQLPADGLRFDRGQREQVSCYGAELSAPLESSVAHRGRSYSF